jgi:hypothetical protein
MRGVLKRLPPAACRADVLSDADRGPKQGHKRKDRNGQKDAHAVSRKDTKASCVKTAKSVSRLAKRGNVSYRRVWFPMGCSLRCSRLVARY